jgi:RNA polymerase primary sigma factor
MRQLKITKQVTNRDTPSLDKYLQEIGKVDLVITGRRSQPGEKDQIGRQ